MAIDDQQLQRIIEGALLASGKPLTIANLADLFDEEERPENDVIRAALEDIEQHCAGRGFELKQVSSGYRFQVVQDVARWVGRLWEEKPQKYSRALLETLALIAYRQPITRGDIEDIRGVSVSSNIIKTLTEREWVRVVGHKDVPGRPAMYATTKRFLDYFNMKTLEELPALAEIRDLDSMNAELPLEGADSVQGSEDGGQKTEDSVQGSEDGGQKTEDSAQESEDRGQTIEEGDSIEQAGDEVAEGDADDQDAALAEESAPDFEESPVAEDDQQSVSSDQ